MLWLSTKLRALFREPVACVKDAVKMLIEIKKHGVYYKKTNGVYEIKKNFLVFRNTGKPFVYLTVMESSTFIAATQKILGKDAFF